MKIQKIFCAVLAAACVLCLPSCVSVPDEPNESGVSEVASSASEDDSTDDISAVISEAESNEPSEPSESSEEASEPSEPFEEPSEEASLPEESSEPSEEPSHGESSVYESEGILIVDGMGMEQFRGTEASARSYSECVSKISSELGSGVRVYSMVAPHASVYYAPKSGEYSSLLSRGRQMHELLESLAGDNVTYVDAYSVLAEHTDEYIYFKTEHHWTGLAGYYAAREFALLAGVEFPDISEYEEHIKAGFVGSLYKFSGNDETLKNNPDEIHYHVNTDVEFTAYYCYEGNYDFDNYDFRRKAVVFDNSNYSVFLAGDSYAIKIATENTTGRTLVVLKDSYGNAVVPYLLSSFDTIYVLDYRNYKKNCCDFATAVGATDVLVIASGFTACGTVWKQLEAMRTAE